MKVKITTVYVYNKSLCAQYATSCYLPNLECPAPASAHALISDPAELDSASTKIACRPHKMPASYLCATPCPFLFACKFPSWKPGKLVLVAAVDSSHNAKTSQQRGRVKKKLKKKRTKERNVRICTTCEAQRSRGWRENIHES